MCKFQKIIHDNNLVIHRCLHNTEPNELAYRIKEDYERQFQDRHFVIGNRECPYGRERIECMCPCFEEK